MKNKKFLLLLILLVVVIIGASALYSFLGKDYTPEQLSTTPSQEETQQQNIVPDFTVFDLEGNPVKLSDYFGKPIVLNFWASWCRPCKSEMPDFQRKANELQGEVVFLMINMTDGYQETVDTASAFIRDNGYTFPVFYDTQGNAANTYGVYSLPTTIFIDRLGNGVAQATGALTSENLQKGIDMIYGK